MKRYTPDPEAVAEWVRESCEEQGVPVHIEDPEILEYIAALFAGADPESLPKPWLGARNGGAG